MITVKLEGFKELADTLNALPDVLRERILKAAVHDAAKVVEDGAALLVPKRTGNVARNIVSAFARKESSSVQVTYHVGVRRKMKRRVSNHRNIRLGVVGKSYAVDGDAYYWRFLEFGTSKMAAKPFLRPAFDGSKGRQLAAIEARIRGRLLAEARKVARQKGLKK